MPPLRSILILLLFQPDPPPARHCHNPPRCAKLDYGFFSCFCFPSLKGIKTGKKITDIDYAARSFTLRVGGKTFRILHGSGPLWGSGNPPDPATVRDYQRHTFRDQQGDPLHDTRWTSPNGNRNRLLSRAFETAEYRDVPPQQSAALDKLMDNVCVLPIHYPSGN